MSNQPLNNPLEPLQWTVKFFDNLLASLVDGIVITDDSQNIVVVNEAFCALFGWNLREIIETNLDDRLGVLGGNVPVRWAELVKRLYGEDCCRDVEFCVHTDRGIKYLSVDASLVKSESPGRADAIVSIWRDVTGHKQDEIAIKKLNEDLRQRTMQLEASNKELEAFSYSVSHDLRAPLRAVDGFSRLLAEDYSDKLDAEGARLLGVVRHNAQKMGQLIDDLLAFSRMVRREMVFSVIDMEGLARSVFEELKAMIIPQRAVQCSIKGMPAAKGDPSMIRQVFANLLSNAVKFTKLRETALIEVCGVTEGNENVYSVKDNGVGFDMKYADNLFGVFQRLHSESEFEGTGVGLAIVQRIIHRHGGRVWAEGKVDEGATFYFTLPAMGKP